MLELRGLGKRFHDVCALQDIDLCLNPGEITLLLGPNGAGKTTLHHCLAGVLFADSGEMIYEGQSVTTDSGIPYSIGYHGDRDCLEPDLKVKPFLYLMACLRGVDNPEAESNRWLEKFHLQAVSHQRIRVLSLGFRQRVSLAQAFIGDPNLLLLDEPGNGLDPEEFRHLENLLEEEKKKRMILVSTHRIREARGFADHLVFLDHGRILRQGRREEVLGSLSKPEIYIELCKPHPRFPQFLKELEIEFRVENNTGFYLQPRPGLQSSLFKFLSQKDCEINEFKTLKPDLEEVFFATYGKSAK